MSALSVCSGTRPSLYCSVRAISAPPNLPAHFILIPFAPILMAEDIAVFIARLKDTRASSCCAMFCETRLESISGRLISLTLICTSLFVIFLSSSLRSSICSPPLPMITPGRDVLSVRRILLGVLSMITLESPPFLKRASRYSRSFVSSSTMAGSFSSEYQLESHPLIIPNLSPVGLVFCPKLSSLLFSYSFFLFLCHYNCDVATALINSVGSAHWRRLYTFKGNSLINKNLFYIQQIVIKPFFFKLVTNISCSRFHYLRHINCSRLVRKCECRNCTIYLLSSNLVGNQSYLSGRFP